MNKYYISITDDSYVTICAWGDKNGDLFESELHAYNFLKEAHENGEITFIEEEKEGLSGTHFDDYIICKNGTKYCTDGKKYRVFIEEINKFAELKRK
jgi:hypothetical protein